MALLCSIIQINSAATGHMQHHLLPPLSWDVSAQNTCRKKKLTQFTHKDEYLEALWTLYNCPSEAWEGKFAIKNSVKKTRLQTVKQLLSVIVPELQHEQKLFLLLSSHTKTQLAPYQNRNRATLVLQSHIVSVEREETQRSSPENTVLILFSYHLLIAFQKKWIRSYCEWMHSTLNSYYAKKE